MSRGRDCRRFVDDLSGFVDQTLGERRLGQVCQHLAGCASCREAVAGIQALRSRLSSSASPCPPAPASLTERLERIAGGERDEPLYLTPGRGCSLPTRAEQLRRRLTRSGAVTVVILATLLGLTLVLGQEPKPVANPVGQAREQYYLSLTAISVNEAVGATMWARERGMSAPVTPVAPRWVDPQPTTPVAPAEAMAVLGRNRHEVTFSGRQRVWLTGDDGVLRANEVHIDEIAGQGASVTVFDAEGQAFSSWFIPMLGCCGLSGEMDRDFHAHAATQMVAGRAARVLEARRDGVVVSRWWVDVEHDVVLWYERYDATGGLVVAAGFLEITFGVAELNQDAVPAMSLQAASSADRAGWCQGLPRCPMALAGLPLVAYATSGPREGPWQRLVYSDGMRTLSVSWTSGVIGEVTRMDDDTRGQPHVSIWQAGNGVISVTTSDSRALLARACAELPGERAGEFSLGDRFSSGLRRLLGIG